MVIISPPPQLDVIEKHKLIKRFIIQNNDSFTFLKLYTGCPMDNVFFNA